MTKYERFVLWLNRFYHKQNKITICVLYTLIMAILGVLIYGATHQQASSTISVKYTRPTLTLNFDANGGELSTIGGGVTSKQISLGDSYGDLPVPYLNEKSAFFGWQQENVKSQKIDLGSVWQGSATFNGITWTSLSDGGMSVNGTLGTKSTYSNPPSAWDTRWVVDLSFFEVGKQYCLRASSSKIKALFRAETGSVTIWETSVYKFTGQESQVAVYPQIDRVGEGGTVVESVSNETFYLYLEEFVPATKTLTNQNLQNSEEKLTAIWKPNLLDVADLENLNYYGMNWQSLGQGQLKIEGTSTERPNSSGTTFYPSTSQVIDVTANISDLKKGKAFYFLSDKSKEEVDVAYIIKVTRVDGESAYYQDEYISEGRDVVTKVEVYIQAQFNITYNDIIYPIFTTI